MGEKKKEGNNLKKSTKRLKKKIGKDKWA